MPSRHSQTPNGRHAAHQGIACVHGSRSHLHHCAGEAVQHEASPALWPLDVLLDQPHHNLVRHQRARLHGLLCLHAVGGSAAAAAAVKPPTARPLLRGAACALRTSRPNAGQGFHNRTSRPSGVLAATAARSMSPVARWHRQFSFLIMGDWVPLPQPGGPAGDAGQCGCWGRWVSGGCHANQT